MPAELRSVTLSPPCRDDPALCQFPPLLPFVSDWPIVARHSSARPPAVLLARVSQSKTRNVPPPMDGGGSEGFRSAAEVAGESSRTACSFVTDASLLSVPVGVITNSYIRRVESFCAPETLIATMAHLCFAGRPRL